MAVEPIGKGSTSERVTNRSAVPISVNVSDEFSPGIAGFIERWKSLSTGLGITAKRSIPPANTLRYPTVKLEMTPRWRGALVLRGALGRDEIPILEDPSPVYNAQIDALYRKERLAPCVGNCPANVDARGQNYFIAENRHIEAYELVRTRNVMPGVLGRICHHPCERRTSPYSNRCRSRRKRPLRSSVRARADSPQRSIS